MVEQLTSFHKVTCHMAPWLHGSLDLAPWPLGQRPTQGLKGPLTRSSFGQSWVKFGPKGLPQGLVEIFKLGIWSEASPGPIGPTDKLKLWSEPG